ncbi:hypothetical protein CONLIGDRAFT_687823 [Coniochaeta ligniaria NRRL 30616]|uniref:Uncharacterized protein n=1 Tax=Coniochaeta ligniaria NRRL 30616 TaxID=1408157 RepID=A0A1J7I452_9PEZI|nr:hypothetical protein CONLIGDRAFT_687823 [Coniochaeta ligniaria NRRL 30616]
MRNQKLDTVHQCRTVCQTCRSLTLSPNYTYPRDALQSAAGEPSALYGFSVVELGFSSRLISILRHVDYSRRRSSCLQVSDHGAQSPAPKLYFLEVRQAGELAEVRRRTDPPQSALASIHHTFDQKEPIPPRFPGPLGLTSTFPALSDELKRLLTLRNLRSTLKVQNPKIAAPTPIAISSGHFSGVLPSIAQQPESWRGQT